MSPVDWAGSVTEMLLVFQPAFRDEKFEKVVTRPFRRETKRAGREFLDFLCLNNLKFLLTLPQLSNKTIPSFIIEEKRFKSSIMSVLSRKCIVLFFSW